MIMITRDGDTSGEDSTDLYRRRIRRALGLDVNGPPDGDELSAMSAACMLVRSELFLLAMGREADGESILAFSIEAETAVAEVGMPAFLEGEGASS